MGETLAQSAPVMKLVVEGVVFPSFVSPPGSSKTHFLAGAGVRGLEINGMFVAFTAIGIYLENQTKVFTALATKWRGKTEEELAASPDFYRDIYTGPFEKFTSVTMIRPLTGQQYTDKVSENCVAYWKAIGIYTDAEAKAIEKFKEVFKPENFPPGSSILFTHSPCGSLTIAFSKDGSIPETAAAVIENKALTIAILESIIGEHGVSPAAKQSLALRLSNMLNKSEDVSAQKKAEDVKKEDEAIPA